MKIAPNVGVALAVVAALLLANYCGRREGARTALAEQRDKHDDSTVSRLAFELTRAEHRLSQQRDSTSRVIRRLQQRIAGGRPATPKPPTSSGADSGITSLPADEAASAPLLLRDSLIASLVAGRSQDSLQILFWRSQVNAYQDTVVPALQRARNDWRTRAERPRFTITDIAGGVVLGWGLAKDHGEAVKLGAGLIVVPRVIRAVVRIGGL